MKANELADRFASLLFPQGCVLCGDAVEYDNLWCGRCVLPEVEGETCFLCGHPMEDCVCGRVKWAFRRSVSPLQYTGGVREAALRLKKKPERRTSLFFAHLMKQIIETEYGEFALDCLAEVPMSPQALARRGHNPPELLAAELGFLLNLPFERRTLRRLDASGQQHTLDAAARFENAAKSYQIALPGAVRGKHVLLVDDVMTTGATLHSCAAALTGAGAKAVYCAAAAVTLLKRG